MRWRHFRLILFFVAFVCLTWSGQLLINTFLPLCQWAPFRVHPTAPICQLVSRMSVIRRTARNQARASVILRETIQLYSTVQTPVRCELREEVGMNDKFICLYDCVYWSLTTDADSVQWSDPLERITLVDSRVSQHFGLYVSLLYAVSQANIQMVLLLNSDRNTR